MFLVLVCLSVCLSVFLFFSCYILIYRGGISLFLVFCFFASCFSCFFVFCGVKIKFKITQRNQIERAFSSPSQSRDSDVPKQHEITAKCLRTQVGNLCTHALMCTDTHAYRHNNAYKRINTPIRTGSFVFLSLDPVRNVLYQHVAEFLQW